MGADGKTLPVAGKSIERKAIERLQASLDSDIDRIKLARRAVGELSWEPTQKELSDILGTLRGSTETLSSRIVGIHQQYTEEYQQEHGIE